MMEAGRLRHRVTVQRFDGTVDSFGDPLYREDDHWVDVCRVWADIEPLSSREWTAMGQPQGETTCKILLRYRSDIRSDMRIVRGTRRYAITAPPIDLGGAGQWTQIYCREVEA